MKREGRGVGHIVGKGELQLSRRTDGLGVGVDAAAADEATTEGRLAEGVAALTELN